jgi:putative salt-induced outer membrane protein YdiY
MDPAGAERERRRLGPPDVRGMWLRGEIEVLRRDSLEFDSEELDTLNLDWEDVAEVRTTRLMTLCLSEGRVVPGSLTVKGDRVAIRADEVLFFDREELLSIIPGIPSEKNYRSGKITLGTTVRRGNTEQTDSTADLRVLRRTPSSRIELKYHGLLSSVRDTEIANSQRLDGRWDRYVSRRFYVSPLFFEASQDQFQNIDVRLTPGAGVGYTLADTGAFEWEVDAGLGYQYVRHDSVEAGEEPEQSSAALLLGTALSADLTKRTEVLFEYRSQLAFSGDIGDSSHLSTTLSVDVVGDLDLDVTFIWDHNSKPATNVDGETPKPDGLRLEVGFGWSF